LSCTSQALPNPRRYRDGGGTRKFCKTERTSRESAKRKDGRIVALASVTGFMSPIDIAPYGIAKSGVIGLTRSMVLKLADYGIIANAIAPGPSILKSCARRGPKKRSRSVPIICGLPLWQNEEIARVALFLTAPDSGYISGASLVVDEGWVAAGAYMVKEYCRRLRWPSFLIICRRSEVHRCCARVLGKSSARDGFLYLAGLAPKAYVSQCFVQRTDIDVGAVRHHAQKCLQPCIGDRADLLADLSHNPALSTI
jgi:Enoyl-(Acyl carrier protein) reductase